MAGHPRRAAPVSCRVSVRRRPAVVVGLAVVCLLLVTSCGTRASSDTSAAGVFRPGSPGTLTVAATEVPDPGFWEGSVAAPNGGFEMGLADALARQFGLGTVRVVEVPLSRLGTGDLAGADVALAHLTPTVGRAEHLDFSTPYLPATAAVLIRTGTAVPDVYSAQRLRWSVAAASTLADDLAEQIHPIAAPTLTGRQAESLDLLAAGQVDAVLLDLPVAVVLASRSGGKWAVAAQLPARRDIAAAVPHGSPNAAAIDSAIRRFTSNGVIAGLADRWLGNDYQQTADRITLLRTGS